MSVSLLEVGQAVKRLQWFHHRDADRRLRRTAKVSLVQWDVLRHLDRTPAASLHDLAQRTFQSDQAMGALARRMIVRGLIVRVDAPGRAIRHELTTDGRTALDAGANTMSDVLKTSIGTLTAQERTTLHQLLTKALPD